MKTSHIFWGTLFIFLGLLILINNLIPFNLNWGNLWQYWPVVLVLFGIAVLVRNKVGKGIIAGVAAVFLAITLFTSVKLTSNFINGDFEIIFDNDTDSNYTITEYTELVTPSIEKASFELNAGMGTFNIKRTTDDLVYVKTKGVKNNYSLKRIDSDNFSNIRLNMKEKTIHIGKNNLTNRVDISLNEKPSWDIEVNVGAAKIDLNLKKFIVENLSVDMGAASLDLDVGDLSENTNIKINAGASEINIYVPKNTGCQLKIDDVLSSVSLKRFDRVRSGLYRTPGFDETIKKIYVEIDCGVSSIKVRRY